MQKSTNHYQNNDQKCFLWCRGRHINPVKIHPERITQKHNAFLNNLDYSKIKFSLSKEDFSKIETKNKTCINFFLYENKLTFLIYTSDQKFENSMDLLFIINKTSHIMCISKILTDSCFTKQKIKTENSFSKVVNSVLGVKMYWQNAKKFVYAFMANSL